MKNTSKRMLFVLLAIIFLLGSVVVYSALIRKTYGEVSTLRGLLASKTNDLDRYQTTFQKVQTLLSQLSDATKTQKQVSLILPPQKDASYLAGQILGLSKLNSLNVETLGTQVAPTQPSQSSIIRSVGKMKAEIKLDGTYGGFKTFLKQLEHNTLLIDLSNMRVEGSLQGQNVPLTYTVDVISYYQAQ